jgi:hypothetical protein
MTDRSFRQFSSMTAGHKTNALMLHKRCHHVHTAGGLEEACSYGTDADHGSMQVYGRCQVMCCTLSTHSLT